MAGFLLAAIKTLALPEDKTSSPTATEAFPAVFSTRTSPRILIPSVSVPAATEASISAIFDFAAITTSKEAVVDHPTPSLGCPFPAVSGMQPNENPIQLTVAMPSTDVIPEQFARNSSMESSTADNSPQANIATRSAAVIPHSSPTHLDQDFSTDDFQFVPFEDAVDSDDWLLIPEEFKTFTEDAITANSSSMLYLDSLGNNPGDPLLPFKKDDFCIPTDQESESLGSFELHDGTDINFQDIQYDTDDVSLSLLRTTSPLITFPSSDNDGVDFPENKKIACVEDTNSDCSGIGFKELFNDPMSEELDWEDDHFHDCGDEFSCEIYESFYSERESEPLLTLEESSSSSEECIRLLFHERENDLDHEEEHETLDVVEELQPTVLNAVSSGYPVNDLPILEGNFFHLAASPPVETKNKNVHSNNGAMFLFEIPEKYNEESIVQNTSAIVQASIISGQEINNSDVVFRDFDSSLHPSAPMTQEFHDATYPFFPNLSRDTSPLSHQKTISFSSLPLSEAIIPSSSDSSSMSSSSSTLSSDFFPCTDNLSTDNEVDQLDSLEEKCFKIYEDDNFESSFDCFPMRLQSARKVDYRGCGTRKSRRLRKRCLVDYHQLGQVIYHRLGRLVSEPACDAGRPGFEVRCRRDLLCLTIGG
ncbi:hypothetical protein FHG87_003173 [Trinorchestia longiramus]|nr:hypothetical protein FHG87_003173 [Trinorchestia longiramus]